MKRYNHVMQGGWQIFEVLAAGFFAICLADAVLEFGLIHLLRRRHHGFWIEAGSPKASLWGYIHNSFNARNYVMSQADRDRHDNLLSRYCWGYRVFALACGAFVALTAGVFLIAVVQKFLRK